GPMVGGAVGAGLLAQRSAGIDLELGLNAGGGALMLAASIVGRIAPLGWRSRQATSPFFVVGYSRLSFYESSAEGAVYGAGVDFRLNAHRALRIEFRDTVRRDYPSRYGGVRVGLVVD